MDIPLTGQLYKNASGRNTYEIYYAEPEFLPTLAQILESQFGFGQQGKFIVGIDEVFATFSKGEITLELGWDNWSGCYVMAQQSEGDEIVVAIGETLDAFLKVL